VPGKIGVGVVVELQGRVVLGVFPLSVEVADESPGLGEEFRPHADPAFHVLVVLRVVLPILVVLLVVVEEKDRAEGLAELPAGLRPEVVRPALRDLSQPVLVGVAVGVLRPVVRVGQAENQARRGIVVEIELALLAVPVVVAVVLVERPVALVAEVQGAPLREIEVEQDAWLDVGDPVLHIILRPSSRAFPVSQVDVVVVDGLGGDTGNDDHVPEFDPPFRLQGGRGQDQKNECRQHNAQQEFLHGAPPSVE